MCTRVILALMGMFPTCVLCAAGCAEKISPGEQVLVIACDDADSIEVAQHYVRSRHVPGDQLLIVKTGHADAIRHSEYRLQIEMPVARLLRDRPNVRYVALCYGVPYKLLEEDWDPARDDLLILNKEFGEYVRSHDWASVDLELACVRLAPRERAGWRANPMYHDPNCEEASLVLRVCRIDGPRKESALNLIQRAQESERRGAARRAMIDVNPPGAHLPGYSQRNARLTRTGKLLEKRGFAVQWETSCATELRPERWGRPAIYLGWYGQSPLTSARTPDVCLSPGTFAMHVHSHSASDLRSATRNWAGPLVELGATGVVGTVFEPMTEGFPESDRLIQELLNGKFYGEAVYCALPRLSWVTVVIGDPLWRFRADE